MYSALSVIDRYLEIVARTKRQWTMTDVTCPWNPFSWWEVVLFTASSQNKTHPVEITCAVRLGPSFDLLVSAYSNLHPTFTFRFFLSFAERALQHTATHCNALQLWHTLNHWIVNDWILVYRAYLFFSGFLHEVRSQGSVGEVSCHPTRRLGKTWTPHKKKSSRGGTKILEVGF